MSSFRTTRPLRFGDCDPSGIAYFPAYFNILVGVVEEFFADIGASWPALFTERKLGMPTVKFDVTYTAPGMHGDTLDWELRVVEIGRSSLTLQHSISRAGTPLWTATQVLVATTLETHKSVPWPDDIRAALTRHLDAADA
ncbi:MAG: thioesterase family protein [Gemmatimonadetes bacterium]|nr:thioesterase family protein [Gemmatimonadota bacterium]